MKKLMFVQNKCPHSIVVRQFSVVFAKSIKHTH